MMFDISGCKDIDALGMEVAKILGRLEQMQYKVKNIYFWDHGTEDDVTGKVTTQMGTVSLGETEWTGFGKWMSQARFSGYIPTDCVLHLMHCYAGADNQSLLKTIAASFNRTVEGCDNTVSLPGVPFVYDPTWEEDGPDYRPDGTVWQVKPGQQPTAIYTPPPPAPATP